MFAVRDGRMVSPIRSINPLKLCTVTELVEIMISNIMPAAVKMTAARVLLWARTFFLVISIAMIAIAIGTMETMLDASEDV